MKKPLLLAAIAASLAIPSTANAQFKGAKAKQQVVHVKKKNVRIAVRPALTWKQKQKLRIAKLRKQRQIRRAKLIKLRKARALAAKRHLRAKRIKHGVKSNRTTIRVAFR